MPNASCSFCIGCPLGWRGKTCDGWFDPSAVPEIVEHMSELAQQGEIELAGLKAFDHVLPNAAGWGINLATGQLAPLPAVSISCSDKNKVYGRFCVPDGFTVTPYESPAIDVQVHVFRNLTALEAQRAAWASANSGRAGLLFGGDPAANDGDAAVG